MTNPDETETGMSFIADDFDVEYINVSDVHARGGNITVTGSYLAGSGTLRAASDAEITIENHSNRFLRLNRLVIDDSGGHLFFNKNDVTSLEMLPRHQRPREPRGQSHAGRGRHVTDQTQHRCRRFVHSLDPATPRPA